MTSKHQMLLYNFSLSIKTNWIFYLKDVYNYSLAQSVAEITNTSNEPVLFEHLSCIIAGWKGSGKTTVVRLLESERWDDVFEDKGIGCTISAFLIRHFNSKNYFNWNQLPVPQILRLGEVVNTLL